MNIFEAKNKIASSLGTSILNFQSQGYTQIEVIYRITGTCNEIEIVSKNSGASRENTVIFITPGIVIITT